MESEIYVSKWLDVVSDLATNVATWRTPSQIEVVARIARYLEGAYERVGAERDRGDVGAYRRVVEHLHGRSAAAYRERSLAPDLERLEAVLEVVESASDSLLLPLSVPVLTWFDIAEKPDEPDEVLAAWNSILGAPLEVVVAAVALDRDASDSNAERAAIDAHPRMVRTLADVEEIVSSVRSSRTVAAATGKRGDILEGLDIRDPDERSN